MKRLRFLFLALLFPSFILSQWQTYQLPTDKDFIDVCVVNPNIIWAAGYDGSIFKTSDGGNTWFSAKGDYPELVASHITAIDQNKAWVTGIETNGIFMTTNGGINWIEVNYSPKKFINKIHFFNANTGYFLSDQVNDTLGFFISRNGGLSWHRSLNAPSGLGNFFVVDNMVNQLDTNFIWFNAINSSTPRFYKLTGGLYNQWQYVVPVSGWARGTIFKDYQNGLLFGDPEIYKTTNAGNNWSLIQNSSINGTICDFINVPGTEWVILNNPRGIIISRNFCNTMQSPVLFPPNSYNMLYSDCKDTNSIWIAADNGRLLKYNHDYIGINTIGTEVIPVDFSLSQNYPNPFNPETKIRFTLPEYSEFNVSVYDILGNEVYSVKDSKQAGTYELTFDGSSLASGVYFYKLTARGFIKSKSMVLIK